MYNIISIVISGTCEECQRSNSSPGPSAFQAAGKQTIGEALARQKKYFDAAYAAPNYKVRELVLLSNARRNTRKRDTLSPLANKAIHN